MTQLCTFSTGGFVIHKIPYGDGKLSAWFDADRNLLDAEKFDKRGRACKCTDDAKDVAMMYGRCANLGETP